MSTRGKLRREGPRGIQDAIAMYPPILPSCGHALHHTAIVWTRLHGGLAAGGPDGWSTATFG